MANGFIKRLPNGRYRVRWRDPDGSNRSRTFDRRPEALTWLAHVRKETALAVLPLPRSAALTLGQVACEWWERKRPTIRTRTAVVYETALRVHIPPNMAGTDIRQVKPRDIETLLAGLPAPTARIALWNLAS
jgi:hypothetical protein